MKTARTVLHMMLASYLANDPDQQVLTIAKRTAKRTHSKRTKRTMQTIINAPRPAELVKRVYEEVMGC